MTAATEQTGLTVVFGGGGVWGVAWLSGLVAGLADLGLDLCVADRFIGTSAGSVIAAQLSAGLLPEQLCERQTNPSKQPAELMPDLPNLAALAGVLQSPWPTERARLEVLSRLALAAATVSASERRDAVALRLGLPSDTWPSFPLGIAAIDLPTLDLTVLDRSNCESVIDAVTASCAIPGIWPPASIGGRRYVDGGVWRTAENAHLAAGSRAVLVLSPMALAGGLGAAGQVGLIAEIAELERQGSRVALISADDPCLATMGSNPLDPATRGPAAEAGRLQASRARAKVEEFFDFQ